MKCLAPISLLIYFAHSWTSLSYFALALLFFRGAGLAYGDDLRFSTSSSYRQGAESSASGRDPCCGRMGEPVYAHRDLAIFMALGRSLSSPNTVCGQGCQTGEERGDSGSEPNAAAARLEALEKRIAELEASRRVNREAPKAE